MFLGVSQVCLERLSNLLVSIPNSENYKQILELKIIPMINNKQPLINTIIVNSNANLWFLGSFFAIFGKVWINIQFSVE